MNERMRKSIVASALVAIAPLTLGACKGESYDPNSEPHDSATLGACPERWGDESIRITGAKTASKAHAVLQRATSELVKKVQADNRPGSQLHIAVPAIPAEYADATSQLFHMSNDAYYKLDDRVLDEPVAEFCIDDIYLTYKTPAYVAAEQALEAAGIELDSYKPEN